MSQNQIAVLYCIAIQAKALKALFINVLICLFIYSFLYLIRVSSTRQWAFLVILLLCCMTGMVVWSARTPGCGGSVPRTAHRTHVHVSWPVT